MVNNGVSHNLFHNQENHKCGIVADPIYYQFGVGATLVVAHFLAGEDL